MVQLLTLTPDYGKFDIRACPIWAIPQLAELKRRLSYANSVDSRPVILVSFVVCAPEDGVQCGRFVIDILDENIYYGYIYASDMNKYKHPVLISMY